MKNKVTIILLLILMVSLSLTAYADSNYELFRAVERGDKGEVKDLLGGFFLVLMLMLIQKTMIIALRLCWLLIMADQKYQKY